MSVIELGNSRTASLEIIEEKSSPIFLNFGTDNCLEHFTVFASMSVCQQLILKEGSYSMHFSSLCRQATQKNSLNITPSLAELTYSETTREILSGKNSFVFRSAFRLRSVTNEMGH